MISIRGLEKKFGGRPLFSGVTFSINRRERIGLVGLNGTGKTTLLRILLGEEPPDAGEVVLPRNYKLGHLPQNPRFHGGNIREEAARGLPPAQREETWRAEKILSGLGFAESDFPRLPEEFSGGYRMRVCLAQVLVAAPDLLLLDEPTNFLDIVSIRWLARFLTLWPAEILVVSHDRSFLDSLVTHVLGIHRGNVWKIPGTTGDYYNHVETADETWEKQRLNEERKRKQAEEFISRFRAQARHAGMVQSRIKTLEKSQPREHLSPIRSLSFSFRSAPTPARYVLDAREISFSYDHSRPALIESLNLSIEKSDRIGVIGPNGWGKTTLLRLLAGILQPADGLIREHPKCRKSFFDPADTGKLHPELTVEEEIAGSFEGGERKDIRAICGTMLFPGDEALKKVGVLSGGEMCRVLLGKVLAAPANLLLLDEPTHHLDLDAADALLDALDRFPGALVLVSHNEHFLRSLAQRLVIFGPGGTRIFPGGYDDFLDSGGWDDLPQSAKPAKREADLSKKEKRRRRAEFNTRKNSLLRPLRKKVTRLENEIMTLEEGIADTELGLVGASVSGEAGEIARLSRQADRTRRRITELYEQLEKYGNQLDEAETRMAAEEDALPI